MNTISIEPGTARNGILMVRAVNPNHKVRSTIIEILATEGPKTVTEIYTHKRFRSKDGIYLDQSQASQHLAIIRRAGLVDTERDGKFIIYSLNTTKLKAAYLLLSELGGIYGK